MKGKTTIQLFNAVSGKEVKRFEDENIITNNFKRYADFLLSANHNELLDNVSPNTYIPSATFMAFTQGIILFANTLPNDVNRIMPTPGSVCVGNAGGYYAGGDPYRGSYNGNESGWVSNGYKHVWDFTTDKANGSINCICLTTQRGGNYGYKPNISTYLDGYPSYGYNLASDSGQASLISPSSNFGKLIGISSDLKTRYYQFGYTGSVTLRKYTSIGSILGFSENMSPDASDASVSLGANEYLNLHLVNGNLYGLTYNTSSKQIVVKQYDFNLNVLNTYPITNTFNMNDGRYWCILGEYLFMVSFETSYPIMKFRVSTGEYIGSISNPLGYPYLFDNFNSEYASLGRNLGNSLWEFLLFDGTAFYGPYRFPYSNTPMNLTLLNEYIPIWTACWTNSYSGNSTLYSFLYTFGPTLSSINNLAAQVTKTNAQTMKVTYQLNW